MVVMFLIAMGSAVTDFGYWEKGWTAWPSALWLIPPYAILTTIVEYVAITAIIRINPSPRGYFRFAVAYGILSLPLIASFSLLFATALVGQDIAVISFVTGALLGFSVIVLLPAWPVAQAQSSAIVVPTKVFKATKGHRWGLVAMAILLISINRQNLIPPVDKAQDTIHAVLFALGEAGITTLSLIYTAAIGATAFLFAFRNDETIV